MLLDLGAQLLIVTDNPHRGYALLLREPLIVAATDTATAGAPVGRARREPGRETSRFTTYEPTSNGPSMSPSAPSSRWAWRPAG
jgi:hypothetical protein